MDRRDFVKRTSYFTFGMGAFGHVTLANDKYVADTVTATDILGPYYRPNAPLRKNLNPQDFNGNELHLSGTVIGKDGKTPIKNCLIEIWQCDSAGLYDNVSDEYIYRGSQKTDNKGVYHFVTAIPVPEGVEGRVDVYRPAHIHLRISSEGQQDLITQIYFKGDPYLETDPSTKGNLAINRILTVNEISEKKREIRFDVTLRDEYLPENIVYQKISGVYKMDDGTMMEFYRDGDLLFYKINNQIWGGLAYRGSNTFGSKENDTEARFELQVKGDVKVWFRFSRRKKLALKEKKYSLTKTENDCHYARM